MSEGLAKDIQADECGHIGVRGIFSDPIRLPLISVNIKRGGGSNYDNVADGVQVVCAIAPLKETSHSVMLSADVVADLECMPALSVMCVKVQNCDNNFECQSCNSHVNDCMVAEVDASNDDDDDDESIVSVVDNADQLLVNEDVVDCCVSASDEYVADVVTIVVIHDDVGESECANVGDDVLAEQLLLSGDDNDESGMSASVGRVVHNVCMCVASSGDVGAVADCGCTCEADCATHTVVRDADHVRCKRAVNAETTAKCIACVAVSVGIAVVGDICGGELFVTRY